jgi:hypothetical protein
MSRKISQTNPSKRDKLGNSPPQTVIIEAVDREGTRLAIAANRDPAQTVTPYFGNI